MSTTPHFLHLLKAEDIPCAAEGLLGQITPRISRALGHVDLDGERPADQLQLAAVRAALAELSEPNAPASYTPAELDRFPKDRYEEHDTFFRVIRVGGGENPLEEFLRGQLEAFEGHLCDSLQFGSDSSLSAEKKDHLRDGWTVMLALLQGYDPSRAIDGPGSRGGPAGAGGTARLAVPAESGEGAELDPLVRWVLGHHSFFSMIQALIATLSGAAASLRGDGSSARALIDAAAVIMRGSASALRYAGDFSPVLYARRVRPAMQPPHLEPKFSGLQSRDHRYLLEVLSDLRGLLVQKKARGNDEGTSNAAASYRNFLDEMRNAYDEHKYVCARFGGDTEPSLRMNPNSQISSTAILERFKARRIQAADAE